MASSLKAIALTSAILMERFSNSLHIRQRKRLL